MDASVACMPAVAPVASLQVHRGDPAGPMCPDENGDLEPCDPDELHEMCVEAADDAFDECMEDAGFWKRQGCRLQRGGRVMGCTIEFIDDLLSPFNA